MGVWLVEWRVKACGSRLSPTLSPSSLSRGRMAWYSAVTPSSLMRSNLLIATKSAKSSMSIFSSWLAAPYSGVMTYSVASTCGTIAASPWPMPLVSTKMRSKPAHLQAAIASGSARLISEPASRVARLRM